LCALRKDGSEFPAEISLSPMSTPQGSCTIAAIRERREPAGGSAAPSGDRLKTEFLANMSHELRSPLNAIIGFAKLMYNGRVGAVSESHREYLGDILTSAEHLLHVINNVVDLSKVEAGRLDFYPEPLNVEQLLHEVHSSLQSVARSKHIAFECSADPACAEAELDPDKLRQVLYNFLSNALKFTADGGSIQLRAQLEDADHLRIEVSDNGSGVREHDLPELWKPFRQLDAAVARRHPGAGLGLTLTKRIVEQQGGRVGVVSQFGQGSTFFAVLPRKHVLRG
jgi:signal transduction histidine kinase